MTNLDIQCASALKDLYNPAWPKKVYYGGRGGAKSTGCAEALLVQGIENPLRVLCVREIQKSINLSVYSLLKDKIIQYGLSEFYQVKSDTIVGKNGTQFFFEGLQNHTVDSLKSIEKINRCWVEEAHNVTNKSWEILIPSLFRVDDCQLWVTFNTRKVTDPTYLRFVQNADNRTLVKKVSYRDNPWFPYGMEAERLALKKSDYEAYLHVWEGEPDSRHSGSVYARWVDKLLHSKRGIEGLYCPEHPVFTAWDLGWSDSTSIIFWQQVGTETRIIDCYEAFNEDMPHFAEVLESKPYKYAIHFAPQDAGNKLLAAGGKSIAHRARKSGINFKIIPETTYAHRQTALRWLLESAYLDKGSCGDLIHALMSYHYKWDDDRQDFSKTPVHDWSSHYSTACELMARVVRDEQIVKEVETKGEFVYKGDKHGNIKGTINVKAYLKRKARARNEGL